MVNKQSVVITGVSTGIGRSAAEYLLQKGFRVFGSVRKPETGEALRQALGENFIPLVFDVTDQAAIAKARDQVAATLAGEPLFGLVNNAGIAVSGPLELMPIDSLRTQLETNLVAPLLVTQAFLPLLGAQQGFTGQPGRIVNISSVAGIRSLPFLGAYAMSKHGLEAMSEALRRELLVWGIDVIVIGPGAVATPIWDKAESADFGPVQGTVYESPANKLKDFMVAGGRKGLAPAVIAQTIFKALTLKKPKTRYALVKHYFTSWFLPSLLPKRLVDKTLGKNLGLLRKD